MTQYTTHHDMPTISDFDNEPQHLRDEDVLLPVAVQNSFALSPVEGLNLDSISPEKAEEILDSVYTYLGVIPEHIDKYVGRWIRVLGAVVARIEGDTEEIDEITGEVRSSIGQWLQPMFKLDKIDDMTSLNVILAGGGRYGLIFARMMTRMYGPGDWQKPLEVFISQEARSGVNRRTQQTEPRRLYRFAYRRIPSGKATKVKAE